MVNALSPVRPTALRCREIGETDLGAVVDLLMRGFPGRRASYWDVGVRAYGGAGCPCRISALRPYHGERQYTRRRNPDPVSSARRWARNPCAAIFELVRRTGLSPLRFAVDFIALKRRDVTYINISPAPQTWPVVEAQGFRRYAAGQFVAFPAIEANASGVSVTQFSSGASYAGLSDDERQLLADHAAFGCLCLVCHTLDGDLPFVFTGFSIRAGRVRLPCARLLYCRDMADVIAGAGALGRFLLRRGTAAVLLDANGPVPGLHGFYTERLGRKYFKGAKPPRIGDSAYSELASLRIMTLRSAAQVLVDQLVGNGVTHAFCVPGESFLPVLDALRDSPIKVIVCRQEGGAAMMAEAMGKATGGRVSVS